MYRYTCVLLKKQADFTAVSGVNTAECLLLKLKINYMNWRYFAINGVSEHEKAAATAIFSVIAMA
jgi:hypothetical protein